MFRFIRRNFVAVTALVVAIAGVGFAGGAVTAATPVQHQILLDQSQRATSECAHPGIWTECAELAVPIPAGHQYDFIVTSSIHGDPGNNTVNTLFCPATSGPTCITGPEWLTFWPRGVTSGSESEYTTVAATAHASRQVSFSAAVKFQSSLLDDPEANTTTLVQYWNQG